MAIPIAVKDIVDTAGITTTMGSRHFSANVPSRDAEVVIRLREAGAVVVGKTTTHQFAFGPTGDRAANGPCANPHDPSRMAGGSSAGSAAAVGGGHSSPSPWVPTPVDRYGYRRRCAVWSASGRP